MSKILCWLLGHKWHKWEKAKGSTAITITKIWADPTELQELSCTRCKKYHLRYLVNNNLTEAGIKEMYIDMKVGIEYV